MNKIFIAVFTVILVFCFYTIFNNIELIDKIVYELIDDHKALALNSEGNTILTNEITVQIKLDIEEFSTISNIDKEEQTKYRKEAEEYYTNLNKKYLSDINLNNYKSIYISKYSPYIEYTYEADKYYNYKTVIANEINSNKEIETACIKETILNKIGQISNAMYSAGAAEQYADPDYTGNGIKVGILEPGLVDPSAVCFSSGQVTTLIQNYSIESVEEHATHMAAYIGGSDGIAKDVDIYSAYLINSPLEEIEWMISNGVNIINMSYGDANPTGVYESDSALCDYFALNYWTIFVGAVGNEGNSSNLVCNPALGYNVIGVGAGTFGGASESFSSKLEVDGPPKPNILARGAGVAIYSLEVLNSGTSVSCAIVSGLIALLLQKYNAMTYRPDQVMAMLTCSAYQSPYAILLEHGLNEAGGAGLVRYDNFQNQYSAYQYLMNRTGVNGTVLRTVTVTLTEGTIYRTSASWMIYTDGTVASKKFTNYDLYVYDSDGNVVGSATSTNSNVELVTFTVPADGVYTIQVKQVGALQTTKDRVILCHGEMPEALLR